MRFVSGAELSEAIRGTLKGSKRDLAVAYFGAGAAEKLGLRDAARTRIACDLRSGACNPYELQTLMEAGATVGDAPRLHAKVYIGDSSVVVTSANASANGLGEEGKFVPTGLEAGVILEELEERQKVAAWFDTVFENARRIARSELENMKPAWNLRPPPRRPSERASHGSLLNAAICEPQAFPALGFVFSKSENDPAAVAVLKKVGASSVPHHSKDFAAWNKDDLFTEWDLSSIRKWPRHFIAYHLGGRGKLWVRAMRLENAFDTGHGLGGVFCKSAWSEIVHPLWPGYSQNNAETNDAPIARELLKNIEDGEVFVTASELSNFARPLL